MSLRFPSFLPPEVLVLDENHAVKLEDQHPAPVRVSVVLQEEENRNQLFWELAFEDFSLFDDLERASMCLQEVKKHEPEYNFRKLYQSAEVGKTLESKIQ